jgi:outer membrane biosynthesis protein TonB
MSQTLSMKQYTQQDNSSNPKAAAITAIVHGVILFILFVIPMAATLKQDPIKDEEGIEVNLGNSDIGFGDVQPLVPDEPAPAVNEQSTPPQEQIAQATDEQEKETSERDEADAPEVNKPEKKTTPTKKVTTPTPPAPVTKPANTTVSNPKPAPPKPKAVYGGGTGTGGNNSDTYNDSKNQGVAGGKGDQGKPNGSATSDNYNGSGGSGTKSGPRVTRGDRRITNNYYFFSGELDRATINAIIKVTPEGKGTFVGFGPGSTTQGRDYANAISNYLKSMQFNKADHESTVTVQFKFNVSN